MESRENILYIPRYIYMVLRILALDSVIGRQGEEDDDVFYSRFHLFSEEMKFPSDPRFVYVCIPEVAIIRILKVSYEVARVIHGCPVCFYTVYTRGPRVNGRSFLRARVHDSCNKDPRGIS